MKTGPIVLPSSISHSFVLHLERAQSRRSQVERLLDVLGERAVVFAATDGRKLSADAKAKVYRRQIHKPAYPFVLSDTEIGCFLSHREIWKTIVAEKIHAALVVEDDVELDTQAFEAALCAVDQRMTDGVLYRLPKATRGKSATGGAAHVTRPALPGLGMQAQIVTTGAASKLLEATDTFDRPVDTFMQMRWVHGIDIEECQPCGVREIDFQLGGTTIQKKKKSVGERLSREVKRTRYRALAKMMALGRT